MTEQNPGRRRQSRMVKKHRIFCLAYCHLSDLRPTTYLTCFCKSLRDRHRAQKTCRCSAVAAVYNFQSKLHGTVKHACSRCVLHLQRSSSRLPRLRAVYVATCAFLRATQTELQALLLFDSIMPLTPLLGRNQPSIVILLLLIFASISFSTGTSEVQGPPAHLDNKQDHTLLTSDNKASDIQQLTLAQLNAWSVVPQFAEFAGKSAPYHCLRTLCCCESQRRANSL